jgi:hypothetical protein
MLFQGAIAAGDYPKIDSALKYIEDCEMTKELLKVTQIDSFALA